MSDWIAGCGTADGELDVTLPGRDFQTFSLAGSGSLSLVDNIDQPDLRRRLAGSGDVEASGKTSNRDVKLAGSGNAKLACWRRTASSSRSAGSNNAEVAPKL